jgi:hypothetical protein
MTTDHLPTLPAPVDIPLDAGLPLFTWLRPSDAAVAALLADPLSDGPDVIADTCGHVAPYGLVTPTQCGLALCGDCHAEHTCTPCDADARQYGED